MEDPSVKYEFRLATKEDYDEMLEVALNGFIPNEPHAMGLDVTPTQATPLVDWIVKKCLEEPFSMLVIEKATGKVAGIRLYSTGHRDDSKDFNPFDLDVEAFPENVQKLCSLLDNLKKKIWQIEPETNKILRQEISFVDPAHQRRGIATHLLHYGLDFAKLKEDGFDGIQAEATSFANQNLLRKNGYQVLAQTTPEDYVLPNGSTVQLPNDTEDMHLCYLRL